MNLKQVVAALPMLRTLWRFLPGPLRIPVLAFAAVAWVWRRVRGKDPEPPAPHTGDPDLDAATTA